MATKSSAPCTEQGSSIRRSVARLALQSQTQYLGAIPVDEQGARVLAFRAYGAPAASASPPPEAVLFFPGNLNSRLFAPAWERSEALATQCQARVIQIDRPGVGHSTLSRALSYSAFARDVEAFCTALGLERVALVAYSSGGPYALACAAHAPRLSSRVQCVILASSDGQYADATLRAEVPVEAMYGTAERLDARMAAALVGKNAVELSKSYDALKDPHRRKLAHADLCEALLQGNRGPARDAQLENMPWDFDPGTITCPVHIFHGTEDNQVPVTVAHYLAATLKTGNAQLHLVPGENHTLIRRHWGVLLELAQRHLCAKRALSSAPSQSRV